MLTTLAAVLLAAPPAFEVRVDPALNAGKPDGRVLVIVAKASRPEPRRLIGESDPKSPPVLGADSQPGLPGDLLATLDATSLNFPDGDFAKLPPGEYVAQAVLHRNRDLNFPNAPGDLFSKPTPVTLPADKPHTLTLSDAVPDEQPPADTDRVKYLRFPSKLLSDFHGRAMVLRVGVKLPPDFDPNADTRYPLRVHVGGYGSRYTGVGRISGNAPLVTIMLDGAGPFGDPYQVNSANNGPFGDAVVKELIPHVEQTYRCRGTAASRFVDGHSTGGWVSLALQVFYPETFNGCWSGAPDPVDFRAYELMNVYRDRNAYVGRTGFERPSKRLVTGDTVYTVRHECHVERVLGKGGRWELSGKDWGAWNATFGPRGADGLPRPLWDGATGAIDETVIDHWKQYDLRRRVVDNWPTLAGSLRGKLHVTVGDGDDYFLNNAVRLFDADVSRLVPPAEATITVVPYTGHNADWSEREKVAAMLKRAGGP